MRTVPYTPRTSFPLPLIRVAEAAELYPYNGAAGGYAKLWEECCRSVGVRVVPNMGEPYPNEYLPVVDMYCNVLCLVSDRANQHIIPETGEVILTSGFPLTDAERQNKGD